MPDLIEAPIRVEAAGTPPKLIEKFAGRASNGEERASVARMRSPAGWSEPAGHRAPRWLLRPRGPKLRH